MYIPKLFEETRPQVLHEFMQNHPFATVCSDASGHVCANHIPLRFHREASELGTLAGHVARANPVWKDWAQGGEVLVIFQGPHAYVSPSWYPSKQENGKAVPTWNYGVVHARGTVRTVEDPAWLLSELAALTHQQEAQFEQPWSLEDAPADYIAGLTRAIVGVEIQISSLIGKWKISQNQPEPNRQGVIQALKASDDTHARTMARWMETGELSS